MIKQTEKVEDNGWRFDWVDDLGNEFKGLRFYPETSILSSWSRRPHRAAKKNFHPYKINAYSWGHIRQACIQRWGGEQEVVIEQPKLVVKILEVMVGPGEWRGEEWCKKFGRCSVKEYAEQNRLIIRER